MGKLDDSLNYIAYHEAMVGDGHPSLESTLNRALHDLANLLDNGDADTQVRRLNIKITDPTTIDSSVVDNDVVFLNESTGKYEPAFDERALGVIDLTTNSIYTEGLYKFKTLNTLVVNTLYYLDKTNPGKLVSQSSVNRSSNAIGIALSSSDMVIGSIGSLSGKVDRTSTTGSAEIPVGTTAQRDASPADGMIRYNTDTKSYEGYKNGAWLPLGGGATGGGTDDVFYENSQVIATDYSITTGKNAMTTGPISINDGVTVTVPDGSVWVIL